MTEIKLHESGLANCGKSIPTSLRAESLAVII